MAELNAEYEKLKNDLQENETYIQVGTGGADRSKGRGGGRRGQGVKYVSDSSIFILKIPVSEKCKMLVIFFK